MSLSDFQILQKLGDGSYSSVYKVKRLEDGFEYALKKVKISHLSDREKENALNEVRILASVKHKNVASYKQAFFDEPSSSLCIVMEYADNGDVFQKICQYQQTGNLFKEKVIWKIFIQTVRGLKALHDLRILHRDMKSANIFLYRDYTAKLGDLNVSKVAKKGLLYTQTGTPYYASPEVWKDQPYDCKSDIWSLGCVLYEMCSLVPPFRADDMNGLFKKVLKGAYPQIPSNFSMDMRSVIKSLLQVNPPNRPTTEQILDMPVITRRIKKYFKDESLMNNSVMTTTNGGYPEDSSSSELLKTIKFSKNLFKLKLPQPTYDSIQFATLPTHNLIGKGGGGTASRNHPPHTLAPGNGGALTQQEKSTSLPKLAVGSSRNSGLPAPSIKSLGRAGGGGAGMGSSQAEGPASVDEEYEEEDQYDQDGFEYEDNKKTAAAAHHNAYHNNQKISNASKIRSYSGRGPTLLKSKNIVQPEVQIKNEYTDVHVTYNQNTNRSKSNTSHGHDPDNQTPSQKHLNIKGPSLASDLSRGGLNLSPSQQMLQIQAQIHEAANAINKKKVGVKGEGQPTPIDEKAELEHSSQYEDDYETAPPQEGTTAHTQSKPSLASKSSLTKNVAKKSGKRSHNPGTGVDSVNTSIQNQDLSQMSQAQLINERPSQKLRDNSQGSVAAGIAIVVNEQTYKQPSKAQNGGHSTKNREAPHNQLSRSPSDTSLEKSLITNEGSSLTRSHQPSQLGKNVIIKPQLAQPVLLQGNSIPGGGSLSSIKETSNSNGVYKKSPNIDRIVNIYAINSSSKHRKPKKFYMNMVANNNLQNNQPVLNEDIRVKLRQLREGIGYYESGQKPSLQRGGYGNENTSFEINTSGRANNSSVLLPELKGSVSPGPSGGNYQSSLIGKKPSLDRILRGGIQGGGAYESSSQVNRIYRIDGLSNNSISRVVANGGHTQEHLITPQLRQQGNPVPLKVRPSAYSRNHLGGNASMLVGSNQNDSLLDIQGKSALLNK